ncbi:MAG TPA: oxygenase MpaB family protein, partial [Methylomirabilota bacterium]
MPPIGDTSRGPQAWPEGREAARTTWKLHREVVLLAGWGRAILLQLAHPMVAQGVADHSGFAEDSWGRVGRLRRTLAAMLALTFGTPEESAGAAAAINRIHDRVHGQLAEAAGPFASSAKYSAHDPALLAWVHATLLDTFLITYERFVAPLTPAERDRYCREASIAAPRLGVPAHVLPCTASALA